MANLVFFAVDLMNRNIVLRVDNLARRRLRDQRTYFLTLDQIRASITARLGLGVILHNAR
jgi:hypothetical protein